MKRVINNAVIGTKKRKIAIVCIAVVSLCVVVFGCDKLRNLKIDEIKVTNGQFNEIPVCENIIVSDCKRELKSNGDDENESTVQVTYNGKYLYIVHKDIRINCVAAGVNTIVSVDGNTIEINLKEFFLSNLAVACLCPVDISYSVGEFEKGTYLLIIKLHNQQIHSQIVVF
jgi:hypothetical protein